VSHTLTLRTSLAWNSGVQLWCITPTPPHSWNRLHKEHQTFVLGS